MTPWGWIAVGAVSWLVVGVAIGCAVERDVLDGLIRVLMAPAVLPVLWVAGWGMRLPRFKRHKVTPDSLRAALDDHRYERETVSIGWPSGALVLLRSKPKDSDS